MHPLDLLPFAYLKNKYKAWLTDHLLDRLVAGDKPVVKEGESVLKILKLFKNLPMSGFHVSAHW